MKILLCTALLTLLNVIAPARTFTNTKGKTFEATLLSADALVAELVGKDGKKYKVAIETLSAADQKFCQQWAAANQQLRLTVKVEGFTAKGSRKSTDSQGGSSDTSTSSRTRTEQEGYRVTVSNWSAKPGTTVSGLKVEYALVVGYTDTMAKDRRGVKEITKGAADLPVLTGSQPQTVETKVVTTQETSSVATRTEHDSAGERRTSTTAARYRESVDGICLVIKDGNRVVARHTFGKVPKDLAARLEK